MKKALILIVTLLVSLQAQARDERLKFSIADLLQMPEAESRLDAGIKFYFGDQAFPAPQKKLGTFVANKKTNAFNKSDEGACQWAALSALISLQKRAVKEGGNAVVNIHSFYKKNKFSSKSEFECGAGSFVAGVAFQGTVVKLAE